MCWAELSLFGIVLSPTVGSPCRQSLVLTLEMETVAFLGNKAMAPAASVVHEARAQAREGSRGGDRGLGGGVGEPGAGGGGVGDELGPGYVILWFLLFSLLSFV